ncbi:TerB family tellurite resistance protein [Thauera aromatica]|uniref:YcjF family protein n=1 Tax=Thauera aromatica TaxID=59405 RepID=UPI001FFC7B38|nr:TerB family tellurite resistance protein [Thauera aromatica]MCK2087046.1 TerB family tellurite resistance protein [Thauera aromatica]
MNPHQARSIVAVCLIAAFADGAQDGSEREHVRKVAESLGRDVEIDFIALYQDVLLGRLGLEAVVAELDSAALRQLAFELAVGVCEADGSRNPQEAAFLERLAALLGLERGEAGRFVDEAEALAQAPVTAAPEAEAEGVAPAPASAAIDRGELERMILNASILNGALELLPQSMASMAIIPLQIRLVYRIGKAHGYELDRGHIKDFLATTGVGMTGQYVEQLGRKLVGGLFGKAFGKLGRAIGSQATGSAFSFATTYAIGQVALRYYGEGRRLDAAGLKAMFARLFEQARGLQANYAGEIEQRARTLDLGKLTAELRA